MAEGEGGVMAWNASIRIRKFIIKWARDEYGISPTNPPMIKEIYDLIIGKRRGRKKRVDK